MLQKMTPPSCNNRKIHLASPQNPKRDKDEQISPLSLHRQGVIELTATTTTEQFVRAAYSTVVCETGQVNDGCNKYQQQQKSKKQKRERMN